MAGSREYSGDGAIRRAAEMEEASKLYARRLVGPGDALSGRVRASVAKEAYSALSKRDAWLPFRKASPKDSGLLDRMLATEQPEQTFTGECSKMLACVVHAIVHLQPITNADWYATSMERVAAELIASGELEPKATLEDKAMRMTEIIAVAAGGAGLAAYYKALGKPLPPLPAATAGEPFFKSLKDFYSGDIVVEAGYGYSLNPKGGSKVAEAAVKRTGWKSLADFKPTIDSMDPFSKMSLTPYSCWIQQQWMEALYIPLRDVVNFSAKPPPSRCLSRSDLEVVAAAYAGAVTCHF